MSSPSPHIARDRRRIVALDLVLLRFAAARHCIVQWYESRLRDFSLVHARHSTRCALNQGTTMLFGLITHCDTPALRENLALSCNMRASP
jgi:hypothetical protein